MAGPSRSLSLDGIRGLALAAPIVVHLQLAGAGNGLWMAIGMFFTLSGFLITSLALKEIDRTGHLSIRGFYARRLRRLMPGAILVLTLTVLFAWLVSWPLLGALRKDAFAALFWVANWEQLGRGGYWESFIPSLTTHFWSLSLEEQVYLMFPLVLLLCLKVRRRRLSAAATVAWMMGGLTAISWVILWTSNDAARMYLSTWTRMGEATFGCMAAAIAFMLPARRTTRQATIAIVAMILMAAPLWTFAAGDTVDGLRLGITLGTPLSAGVVAMLWRYPASLPARFFSLRVPAWLGRRSYGIYLIHLPLIDLLAYRLHVHRLPAGWMVAAVAATLVLAGLLFRFVEEPIRVGQWVRQPRSFATLIAAGVFAFSTFTVVVSASAPSRFTIPGAGEGTVPTLPGGGTVPIPTLPPTTAAPSSTQPGDTTPAPTTTILRSPPPPTTPGPIVVIGDSTAWVTAGAVDLSMTPLGWNVTEVHMVGCPVGGDVRIKASVNGGAVTTRELGVEKGCDLWWNQYMPQMLVAAKPVMVILVDGYGLAYKVDPTNTDQWCELGDGTGACEPWAAQRLRMLSERIHQYAPGAHYVISTAGHIDPYGPLDMPHAAIDSLNVLLRAEAVIDGASLIDLGSWLDAHLNLTVDGTHLGPDGVRALTPWMKVELVAVTKGERLAR